MVGACASERRRCAYYYTAPTAVAVAAGVTAPPRPRSFGGGGVTIRRCGNITSAMPNHLVTRPSARHARMQQVSWPRSLEARDETDASQEFRALPRSRLRTLSFVEWGTFSCLGRNAVMPLCSLCDCPFLSPLPSTRPPRVGFGSRDAQIGLYCAGFITAAHPRPGDRAYDLVAVQRHFLRNPWTVSSCNKGLTDGLILFV